MPTTWRPCGISRKRKKSGAFETVSRLGDDGRIVRILAAQSAAGEQAAAAMPVLGKMPFHERFGEVTTPVLLFGAGHVGRAVVLALAPLPFTLRWIDSRPDQFPQYVPQNVVTVCTDAVGPRIGERAARRHWSSS